MNITGYAANEMKQRQVVNREWTVGDWFNIMSSILDHNLCSVSASHNTYESPRLTTLVRDRWEVLLRCLWNRSIRRELKAHYQFLQAQAAANPKW